MVCVMTVYVLLVSLSSVSGKCHCKTDDLCETFPVSPCSVGRGPDNCQQGWFGLYCQKENVALKRPSNQSSTDRFGAFDAVSSLAVDGITSHDFWSKPPTCTSNVYGDRNISWTVYLNKTVTDKIQHIKLYLRSYNLEQNKGVNIQVDGVLCYNWSTSDRPNSTEDVTCRQSLPGNTVTITAPASNIYLVLCEVQIFICSDGWFGDGCDKQCNCRNEAEVCDKISGQCSSGCDAGFNGTDCQTYGECHCRHPSDCETFLSRPCSAEGTPDGCQAGWFGPYCQKQNVALKRLSNQSSTFHNHIQFFPASYAVDGRTTDSLDSKPRTCSITGRGDPNPTWTVHLDKFHYIHHLRLYLWSHKPERNKGMVILVDNKVCFNWTSFDQSEFFQDIVCRQPLSGNAVTIMIPRSDKFLILCEVQVFLCSDGWFDEECDKRCRCQNKTEVCDKASGNCMSGCVAGFKGDDCHKPCDDGMYGLGCNSSCGYCTNSSTCDKATGHCLNGCQGNFIGPFCEVSSEPIVQVGVVAAAAGGGAAAVFVVMILIVIVVIFSKRRQRENMESNINKDNTRSQVEDAMDSLQLNAINTGDDLLLLDEDEDEDAVFCVENDLYVSSEDMSTYYNWVPPDMTLDKLQHCVKDKKIRSTLETQLKAIPYGLRRAHDVGKKPENKMKNRFAALYPYDHSRVVLDGNDYINANFITAHDCCRTKDPHRRNTPSFELWKFWKERSFQTFLDLERQYISPVPFARRSWCYVSGPTCLTFGDFWRMIWQERVTTVVMLTQLVEHNKKKCDKYWPKETEIKQYGGFKVTNKEATVRANYTISKLVIHGSNSEERTVNHFRYTTWPDHSVPSGPALVAFWKKVKQQDKTTGPLAVHCRFGNDGAEDKHTAFPALESAGVGRTGTFIALDYLVDEYESEYKVNVFRCVTRMREARMNMVQTLSQYQFVHDAVLEAIYSRDTKYTSTDLTTLFGSKDINSGHLDNKLKQQFKLLQSLRPPLPDSNTKPLLYGNGDQDIIYENKAQLHLGTRAPTEKGHGGISSVILPSVVRASMLVVTRTPVPKTVVDFWRLVSDNVCFTIVCLDTTKGSRDMYPDANKEIHYGSVIIKHVEDKDTNIYKETRMTLTNTNQHGSGRSITVFMLKSLDTMSRDTKSLFTLTNRADEVTCSAGHKVLVHCPDGSHDCGIFCAALNVIGQLRLDSEVDIFLTVRELQCVQPRFIQSYEQYRLCYDLVREFIRSSDGRAMP